MTANCQKSRDRGTPLRPALLFVPLEANFLLTLRVTVFHSPFDPRSRASSANDGGGAKRGERGGRDSAFALFRGGGDLGRKNGGGGGGGGGAG